MRMIISGIMDTPCHDIFLFRVWFSDWTKFFTKREIGFNRTDSTFPVNLNKTFINHFTPRFWYVFEPLITVGFLYRYSIVEYERQHPEDSDEHSIMLNMIHEFSRTFKADLEYLYGERFFDHTNPDYKTNRINAILLKQFKYWTFEADIGYHSRNFKGGTIEDIDIPTCRLAAMFQMPSPPDPAAEKPFSQIVSTAYCRSIP